MVRVTIDDPTVNEFLNAQRKSNLSVLLDEHVFFREINKSLCLTAF